VAHTLEADTLVVEAEHTMVAALITMEAVVVIGPLMEVTPTRIDTTITRRTSIGLSDALLL